MRRLEYVHQRPEWPKLHWKADAIAERAVGQLTESQPRHERRHTLERMQDR